MLCFAGFALFEKFAEAWFMVIFFFVPLSESSISFCIQLLLSPRMNENVIDSNKSDRLSIFLQKGEDTYLILKILVIIQLLISRNYLPNILYNTVGKA